jgi:hypothetical protein
MQNLGSSKHGGHVPPQHRGLGILSLLTEQSLEEDSSRQRTYSVVISPANHFVLNLIVSNLFCWQGSPTFYHARVLKRGAL